MLSGMPYPIVKYPLGFLFSQKDLDQVRSDLLVLLLTNPGERVMLPDFGTPLRSLLFEPNDPTVETQAREMVINSISKWEPRITIKDITVSSGGNGMDTGTDSDHVLGISIDFFNPGKIADVQTLRLEIPINS
jgi:phage baseplate assembly protein W